MATFLVILFLAVVLGLTAFFLTSMSKRTRYRPDPGHAPALTDSSPEEEEVTEEVVAVITAAILSYRDPEDGPFRIRKIKQKKSSWGQAGLEQNTEVFTTS